MLLKAERSALDSEAAKVGEMLTSCTRDYEGAKGRLEELEKVEKELMDQLLDLEVSLA
jgi:hypothetical protein